MHSTCEGPTLDISECSGLPHVKRPAYLPLTLRRLFTKVPDSNVSRDPIVQVPIGNEEIRAEITKKVPTGRVKIVYTRFHCLG